MGDFNLPDINWSSLSAPSPLLSSPTSFVTLFPTYSNWLITPCAHIHLDLVLTNVDDVVQSLTILPGNVTSIQSDHFTIIIKFEISVQAPNNKVTGETRYVFNYNQGV